MEYFYFIHRFDEGSIILVSFIKVATSSQRKDWSRHSDCNVRDGTGGPRDGGGGGGPRDSGGSTSSGKVSSATLGSETLRHTLSSRVVTDLGSAVTGQSAGSGGRGSSTVVRGSTTEDPAYRPAAASDVNRQNSNLDCVKQYNDSDAMSAQRRRSLQYDVVAPSWSDGGASARGGGHVVGGGNSCGRPVGMSLGNTRINSRSGNSLEGHRNGAVGGRESIPVDLMGE